MKNNLQPSHINTSAFFLGLSYFIVFMGQNIWRSTFHSYAVESFQVTPVQIGFIFSITALPGLFSVTIGLLGKTSKLIYLFIAAFLLMGVGLLATGVAHQWYILLIGAFLLHTGFAIYYPTVNSIYLIESRPKKSLRGISQLKSMGPLASIVATGMLIWLSGTYENGSMLAFTAGFIVLTGFTCAHAMEHNSSAMQRSGIQFKEQLWPFYALNFLNGCRSGIFKTFVLFLLVNTYGFNFKITATIVLLGSLMTFIGYQTISFSSNFFKPVPLLRTIYVIIFFNFIGIWLLKSPLLLAGLFLIDSLLFCTSAITDGHLKFTTGSKEILGDLATGVSLYHLGAVIMPVIGGYIYQYAQTKVFLLGSVFALFSFLAAQFLVYPEPVSAPTK